MQAPPTILRAHSGLAHMFEHMAFKGSTEIGTTNYPAEKVALAKVEVPTPPTMTSTASASARIPPKLAQLKKAFEDAQAAAQKYVIPNQFSEIAEQNGAVGINASTAEDSTQYFWSMPSNRLELWAYLESQRIGHPVQREFYKERDVVQEERRMRIDSSPIGRMVEQFLATAYVAHPYGRSGVGWESEICQVTATEAEAFHKKYYVPSNIVIAVVGDLKASEAMPVLERYFSKIPAGPKPTPMTTDRAAAVRRKIRRHPRSHPALLPRGLPPSRLPRSRRLRLRRHHRHLLQRSHRAPLSLASSAIRRSPPKVKASPAFPATSIPGLFAVYAVPLPGHTPEEMRTAIHKELDRLKTEDVSDEELARFKTRARADLLRGLADNDGLAHQLAEYQTRYGDWRQLFRELDKINAVTKADVRRVANKIFVDSNRTSARIEFVAPKKPAKTQGGAE